VYVEIGTSTKTTCATSSTFKPAQREQPIITTKLVNQIKETSLEIILLHVMTLVVHVKVILKPIVTPTLVVSTRVGT